MTRAEMSQKTPSSSVYHKKKGRNQTMYIHKFNTKIKNSYIIQDFCVAKRAGSSCVELNVANKKVKFIDR